MVLFRTTPKKQPASFEPIPVGEVTEGNSEADWSEWENSVAFQDSQMPGGQTSAWAKNAGAGEAFASVTKNSN